MSQPNLLMIHGLMGSIDYFAPRDYLTGLRVFTPDLLDYGNQSNAMAARDIDLPLQADTIAQIIRERIGVPTWLLGHSVGGAVAMLVAKRVPDLITGLISVEGNFTLNDSFWCSKIAGTDIDEWEQQYLTMVSDPEGFLTRSGIAPSGQRLAWAKAILSNQSAATLHSMATSVIHETGVPAYLELVRSVVQRTPIHLLAGERSADGWDVPDWVRATARSSHVLCGVGHMMMLEDPTRFCSSVLGLVRGDL